MLCCAEDMRIRILFSPTTIVKYPSQKYFPHHWRYPFQKDYTPTTTTTTATCSKHLYHAKQKREWRWDVPSPVPFPSLEWLVWQSSCIVSSYRVIRWYWWTNVGWAYVMEPIRLRALKNGFTVIDNVLFVRKRTESDGRVLIYWANTDTVNYDEYLIWDKKVCEGFYISNVNQS